MNRMTLSRRATEKARQRGVATLFVALIILVILTVIVLASTNVTFFEQRTSSNENRGRLAEQAAEYSLNMAGEYLKAKRDLLISNTAGSATTGGWLSTDNTTGRKWKACTNSIPTCLAERDTTRRAQMYYFTTDDSADSIVPYRSLTADASELETSGVGGTAQFATTTSVHALLCRIDSSLSIPACRLTPVSGNRIAITLVSTSGIAGEAAAATVKETWASYSSSSPSSAVPLVASGLVKGVGNAQIVQSPNGAGPNDGSGFQVSIWSPCEVDIEAAAPLSTPSGCAAPAPGNSVGSLNTCSRGDYLKQDDNNPANDVAESDMLTTCAGNGNSCGCSTFDTQDAGRSGHSGATKQEGQDVLDRDGNHGPYPDIQFFPDAKYGLDKPGDNTDDSLFEWIFGVNYEADNVDHVDGGVAISKGFTRKNCTVSATFDAGRPTNCAVAALDDDFGATSIATCGSLNSSSSGIYYVRGGCDLPGQVGSPTSSVIVVVNSEGADVKFNGTIFYGLLFIRSDNDTAVLKGVGNSKVFGSIVVQGEVNIAGTIDIVYLDTSVSSNPNLFPKSAKFGRVNGSWLDSRSGF